MGWQAITDDTASKAKGTREDALAWARGVVAGGIRVVRLRSGKTRRSDRPAALVTPLLD